MCSWARAASPGLMLALGAPRAFWATGQLMCSWARAASPGRGRGVVQGGVYATAVESAAGLGASLAVRDRNSK